MDRLVELRRDFDLLGELLQAADPQQAAAIARERRLIGAELERYAESGEESLVDELAAKRAEAGVGRPPARRRKS